MILKTNIDKIQIAELLQYQPELKDNGTKHDIVELIGRIFINRECYGYKLSKKYDVKIHIPLLSETLPVVEDYKNQSDSSYVHRGTDGVLCLETDLAVRLHFINGFSLLEWFQRYVECYFFSYEYFTRYRLYPFGERPHSKKGMIETCSELWEEPDLATVDRLLEYFTKKTFRGHILCPCHSGKRLRNCHGDLLQRFYAQDTLFSTIKKEYEKYE